MTNVMCGIRDAKDKKTEITEKNCAARAAENSADISDQMRLKKATVEKIEGIEDDRKEWRLWESLPSQGWK